MLLNELPQELVDYCIDFLHHSHESLQSCSLTCNALLNASRYHLFASICLKRTSQFTGFLKILRHHPELASYVRQVRLGDFFSSPQKWSQGAGVRADLASSPLRVVPEVLFPVEKYDEPGTAARIVRRFEAAQAVQAMHGAHPFTAQERQLPPYALCFAGKSHAARSVLSQHRAVNTPSYSYHHPSSQRATSSSTKFMPFRIELVPTD